MKNRFNLEFEGKTIEEAVKKALQKLKLSRDKVKIEVVCEEEKGLFGMAGAKPAKVRVSPVRKDGFSNGVGPIKNKERALKNS